MYEVASQPITFEHESGAPICEWVIERGRVSLSPDPAFLITFKMIKSRIVGVVSLSAAPA